MNGEIVRRNVHCGGFVSGAHSGTLGSIRKQEERSGDRILKAWCFRVAPTGNSCAQMGMWSCMPGIPFPSVIDFKAPSSSPYDRLNHAIFLGSLTVPQPMPKDKPYVIMGVYKLL